MSNLSGPLGDFLYIPTLNTGQLNPLFHTFAEFRRIVDEVVVLRSTDWLAVSAQFCPLYTEGSQNLVTFLHRHGTLPLALLCQGLYSNETHDLLSRLKRSKIFSTFWKIFNSYVYVLRHYDTINNSGRYFTCRPCNLKKNSWQNFKKTTSGHEILVISRYFLKYGKH